MQIPGGPRPSYVRGPKGKGNAMNHQTRMTKRRNHLALREVPTGGYANTGVSRNDLRASDANDEIAEAMADMAEKRHKPKGEAE